MWKKTRFCDTKKFLSESSHDSLHKDTQYRIGNGIIYNCDENGSCNKNSANSVFDLLVGTSPIEYFYGDTWIQFEYANLLTGWNKYALHAYSFFLHKLTGQNVGPLGNSDYAEYKKPLILEICKPEGCESSYCDPIQCVRPKIDLDEYSDNFLREHNISIVDYKILKDFVKNRFDSRSKIIFSSINEIITKYIDDYDSVLDDLNYKTIPISENQYNLYTKIVPYIDFLSTNNNNNTYDREEIIEIMFLILYYANENNSNYDELGIKINERYSTSGGRKSKNKKNTKTTRKSKRKNRKTSYKNNIKKKL